MLLINGEGFRSLMKMKLIMILVKNFDNNGGR